jgi:hypothetical protein
VVICWVVDCDCRGEGVWGVTIEAVDAVERFAEDVELVLLVEALRVVVLLLRLRLLICLFLL